MHEKVEGSMGKNKGMCHIQVSTLMGIKSSAHLSHKQSSALKQIEALASFKDAKYRRGEGTSTETWPCIQLSHSLWAVIYKIWVVLLVGKNNLEASQS